MVEYVQVGGAPAFAVIGFSVLAVTFAIAALSDAIRQRARGRVLRLAGLALLASAMAIAFGVGGYVWAMRQVEVAVASAPPADQEMLRAVGTFESQVHLWFGLGGALPALMLSAIAWLLARRRTSPG